MESWTCQESKLLRLIYHVSQCNCGFTPTMTWVRVDLNRRRLGCVSMWVRMYGYDDLSMSWPGYELAQPIDTLRNFLCWYMYNYFEWCLHINFIPLFLQADMSSCYDTLVNCTCKCIHVRMPASEVIKACCLHTSTASGKSLSCQGITEMSQAGHTLP